LENEAASIYELQKMYFLPETRGLESEVQWWQNV
jgi:hypothetical protein